MPMTASVDPHPEAVAVLAKLMSEDMGGSVETFTPEAKWYVEALIAAGYDQLTKEPRK